MFTFRNTLRILICILLVNTGTSCGGSKTRAGHSSGYYIVAESNPLSEKCAELLYQQLSTRTSEEGIVLLKKEAEKFKQIMVSVDERLETDYSIDDDNHKGTTIKARNEAIMQWLIYQVVARISTFDNRFSTGDMAPAIIPDYRGSSYVGEVSFDYREPFFRPNLAKGYSDIAGTNNVEKDWGIWGHNVSKVLGNRPGVLAKQGGDTRRDQVCFSSEETYRGVESYIVDNYGDGSKKSERFMIMPNDNKITCQCEQCTRIGNTRDNATPAVSALIKRLANRFPRHWFFTSAYYTTMEAPKDKWPDNTGVMLSTINIPKGVALSRNTQGMEQFLRTLDAWKKSTSNIYIWDYAANFDDYLTPIPVLYGLKKQLEFYKSWGVRGVFLNASGHDYSSFDDMKTYAAAALMINTDLSVDSLCSRYYAKFYPVAGKLISNYYLGLERKMERSKCPYNLYGNFKETLTYLDWAEFVQFYNAIGDIIPQAGEQEQQKLKELFTALCYTRMQIAYYQKNAQNGFASARGRTVAINPEIQPVYRQLMEYKQFPNFTNYKEANGTLLSYLNSWKKVFEEAPFENMLMHNPITILSKADEDYKDPKMLNDGVLGFDGNYQQGWLLSSAPDLRLQFQARSVKDAEKLTLRFLIDARHQIYLPDKIEIYMDNRLYKSVTPRNGSENTIHVEVISVDFDSADQIMLRIYKNKQHERSSLACDEVQLN